MRAPRLTFALCLFAVLSPGTGAGIARAADPAGGAPASGSDGGAPVAEGGTDAGPVVSMPVVEFDPGVRYPADALAQGIDGPVVVPLILSIDSAGAVTRVDVEQRAGHGFDEAAIDAARSLRFVPAKRGGIPVAARIRFRYAFAPPPAALSGQVHTLASDRPVEGATIVVRDGSGIERTASSAPDGAWRIDKLPAGPYHVTVRAAELAPYEGDVVLKPGEEQSAIDRLAPSNAGAARAETAREPVAEEVEVRGTRPPREVTKFALGQREIDRIPGTGGDALRSLESLPGVARPPPLSGLLLIRGSAPQDSAYFVDGTPIPIVYHFGGLFSVLPTEAIDHIDFYPGNFSAQFGRAMGGIVDVGLLEPQGDRVHGLAEANLIDARVLVQGPIFKTGWKFTLAGRRSYVDTWLGPVLNAAGANVSVAPVYYDYQAILERDLGSRSSVRFAFFGSDDRLAILLTSPAGGNPAIAGQLSTHTGFWRAQGLLRSKIGPNTELKVVTAVGQDTVALNLGSIYFNLNVWPITGRAEVSQKLDPHLTMNAGVDVIYSPYTIAARLPAVPVAGQPPPGPFSAQQPLQTNSSASIYEPAAYMEWEATPWRGGRIVPGLRLDYAKDTRAWDLDPRVVVRQDVTSSPRTTLKGGVGLFSQPPQPRETNAVFGASGLTSNRAYHYDAGVEREFTRNIEGSAEGFYKQLDHLVQSTTNSGSGVIYGAEVLLRYKPDERFFGWLAYTLSRSLHRDAPGMPLTLSQYDETHVLTVLGSYKLGRGWEIGARFRLTSGYMNTPQQYGYYDENVGTYQALQDYPQYRSRLPLFHSLDIRIDKTWTFRWGSIRAYLDVLNTYNNGNVAGISYNFNATQNSYTSDLPILPSLGMRVDL